MTLDLSPYDAATEVYQDAERDALTIRMIQSLPPGWRLTQAELEIGIEWMIRFQQFRDTMALVLKGVVKITVEDGEVMLEPALARPLGPLDRILRADGIDEVWLRERLTFEGPTEEAPPEQ